MSRFSPILSRRRVAATLALVGCAAVPPAVAAAQSPDDMWSRSIDRPITAAQLDLPADASPKTLAHAAIRRTARRLAGGGRLGAVGFAGQPLPPRPGDTPRLHGLRYRQQIGGLRVLYSQLDVTVGDGRVSSIAGTVVPLERGRLAGERRIGARRARAIARRAVAGPDSARRAEPVAYAGEPAKPRRPRRAYVVEVAPPLRSGDDSPSAICIVVDATTGKVLKRWRGFAARPIGRRPSARAAATKTVLIQIVDAKGTAAAVTPNYRDVYTMGDPRKYGTDSPLQVDTFGTLSPPFFTANSWINGVTGFFCLTRQYCGRDSGLDGSYNRHFYTVNSGGGDSRYVHSQERIYIDSSSGTEPQTIAHEQGHSIDFHFLDDFLQTDEGDEVEEALADMFAYDFERDRTLAGATGVRVSDRVADPTAFSLPDHYSDYSCTTTDEHDNGHILSHGYWKLVQRIGHEAAGQVLQGVPWQLPARREFGDLREAMERAAGNLRVRLPGKIVSIPIRPQVEAAFSEVGVQDNARRTDRCPGATS